MNQKTNPVVLALQKSLALSLPPIRIEAFDISHLSGKEMVGSCICFINGKPAKKEYRQFHIQTVTGIDDFKAIAETVRRRYQRVLKENSPLPDLILIDGGPIQLEFARQQLQELEINTIPIFGLAKRFEELYRLNTNEPLILSKTSAALRLLQALRDEAHRFAVKSHQNWRQRNFIHSALDEIPGVGLQRKKLLLSTYGSLEKISQASKEDLMNHQIPKKTAMTIYNFFHAPEMQIVREKFGIYQIGQKES